MKSGCAPPVVRDARARRVFTNPQYPIGGGRNCCQSASMICIAAVVVRPQRGSQSARRVGTKYFVLAS